MSGGGLGKNGKWRDLIRQDRIKEMPPWDEKGAWPSGDSG